MCKQIGVIIIKHICYLSIYLSIVQLTAAVEYIDCTSAEGKSVLILH